MGPRRWRCHLWRGRERCGWGKKQGQLGGVSAGRQARSRHRNSLTRCCHGPAVTCRGTASTGGQQRGLRRVDARLPADYRLQHELQHAPSRVLPSTFTVRDLSQKNVNATRNNTAFSSIKPPPPCTAPKPLLPLPHLLLPALPAFHRLHPLPSSRHLPPSTSRSTQRAVVDDIEHGIIEWVTSTAIAPPTPPSGSHSNSCRGHQRSTRVGTPPGTAQVLFGILLTSSTAQGCGGVRPHAREGASAALEEGAGWLRWSASACE